jgi:hypothetical protein
MVRQGPGNRQGEYIFYAPQIPQNPVALKKMNHGPMVKFVIYSVSIRRPVFTGQQDFSQNQPGFGKNL